MLQELVRLTSRARGTRLITGSCTAHTVMDFLLIEFHDPLRLNFAQWRSSRLLQGIRDLGAFIRAECFEQGKFVYYRVSEALL